MSDRHSPSLIGETTITLSKRPDVVLVLNKQQDRTTKLLVSSSALSEVSRVFERMFYGPFAESQMLSITNPHEVPLPDDDPASMSLICHVAHFQLSHEPGELRIVDLAELAIACDKYDCTKALRGWIRSWVLELVPQPDLEGYEKLMMITYIFDLPHEYWKVTQALIRYRTFSTDMEIAAHGTDFIPLNVHARLRNGQLLYHDSVTSALDCPRVRAVCAARCTEAKHAQAEYFQLLKKAGLWPTKSLPLEEYLIRISKMKSPHTHVCYSHPRCKSHRAVNMKDAVSRAMAEAINSIQGMCLDCIYKNRFQDLSIECRIPHSDEEY